MKIKQLIKKLTKIAEKNPNLVCVISSDAEGNSFGLIQDIYLSNETFDKETGDLQESEDKENNKTLVFFP